MKRCTNCKQNKSKTDFNKKTVSKDGLQAKCRMCTKKLWKEYYDKNPQKHKAKTKVHNKRYYERNRKFVADYLLKHPCVDCGESNPIVLEFDHISNKSMEVSNMVRHAYSISRIKSEMLKCVVRCANCHRIITAKRANWWIVEYLKGKQ